MFIDYEEWCGRYALFTHVEIDNAKMFKVNNAVVKSFIAQSKQGLPQDEWVAYGVLSALKFAVPTNTMDIQEIQRR